MKRLLLLCYFVGFVALQNVTGQTRFRLLELNAENFFDTDHDKGKSDETFLPDGPRRWTRGRFWKKVEHVCREIVAATDSGVPDIVGLTEVENDSVLTWLTRRSLLRHVGYRYVMTNSMDVRGINVALLYRPETFKPLAIDTLHPTDGKGNRIASRDILHVTGRVVTSDTLDVFVCHLSSRVSGKLGAENRRCQLSMLKQTIQKIRYLRPYSGVIVMGDFNDEPESVSSALEAQRVWPGTENETKPSMLYNLSWRDKSKETPINGTYKYDGRWEMIDQCLVSGNLLQSSNGIYTTASALSVCAPPFLLDKDEEDGGVKPFSTYNGYKYKGGYSDHLPIAVEFFLKF